MIVRNIKIYFVLLLLVLFSGGCKLLRTITSSSLDYMSNYNSTTNTGTKAVFQNHKIDDNLIFSVVGKGIVPDNIRNIGQAKLMAERAAISDGYRQLSEKIRGTYIAAYTKSKRGSIDYDYIYSQTNSWMKGVKIIEIKQAKDNITEAYMSLGVNSKISW